MTRQTFIPDLALGIAVALFGVWEFNQNQSTMSDGGLAVVVIALTMAVAAGLYRLAPMVALVLVWAAAGLQVYNTLDVALVQLAAVIVAYGTARYGRMATVWLSGLSIPIGAGIALFYVRDHGSTSLDGVTRRISPDATISMTTAFLLALLLLSLPWALGMVLRLSAQFRDARAQREQAEIETARAQEIAALRADQARLARDVHDVVGHSLTVILAQADSVQFMDDGDIDRIRAALTNISTSARKSLGDVRQVLSPTNDPAEGAPLPTGGLDSLIDGVRTAGNVISSAVEGAARPMPPELDVVAFRVLQEMLTNALKHGRRGETIQVARIWGTEELRVVVRNVVSDDAVAASAEGIGLNGMQRRLEAVGGWLDVRRENAEDRLVFTATAGVPLRPQGARL